MRQWNAIRLIFSEQTFADKDKVQKEPYFRKAESEEKYDFQGALECQESHEPHESHESHELFMNYS